VTDRRAVFTDASVLINFTLAGCLDVLGSLGLDIRVPEEVVAEIVRPSERFQLDEAFTAGWIQKVELTDPEALMLYADLRQGLGAGESACLALAAGCGGMVACDEKRLFLREACRCLGNGRVLNTPGLLLLAIRRGLLSIREADEVKLLLERHRFRMTFGSFQDLVGRA
jgi:predicted nucleic acid-binding protein